MHQAQNFYKLEDHDRQASTTGASKIRIFVTVSIPLVLEAAPIFVAVLQLLFSQKQQSLQLPVTAEDESGIHIWDIRMLNFPVLELSGYAHCSEEISPSLAKKQIATVREVQSHLSKFRAGCRDVKI